MNHLVKWYKTLDRMLNFRRVSDMQLNPIHYFDKSDHGVFFFKAIKRWIIDWAYVGCPKYTIQLVQLYETNLISVDKSKIVWLPFHAPDSWIIEICNITQCWTSPISLFLVHSIPHRWVTSTSQTGTYSV